MLELLDENKTKDCLLGAGTVGLWRGVVLCYCVEMTLWGSTSHLALQLVQSCQDFSS
jgi:hypothetical protein